MKKAALFFVLLLVNVVLAAASAQATGTIDVADPPEKLSAPSPSWYTPALHQKVLAAGQKGIEIPLPKVEENATELNCLGTSPPSVSTAGVSINAVTAGGCMVYPSGCTMNFIFRDATSYYIGSAGHCLGKGGSVVMQVATRVDPTDTVLVTLASIGRVAKKVDQGIGRDFGIVKIDPGWAVVPGVAGAAGPTGVFCGDPLGQPVAHYGHGYIFFVEQGHPKFGEVILDLHPVIKFTNTATGFNWAGYGLPGDSGSPVMNDVGLAVGDLTHGIGVLGVPIPGLSFGTTAAGMFSIAGAGISMVTVDGRRVDCASAIAGLVDVI